MSQSIPILMLVAKWEWWYHHNALAFKSRMRQNNHSHHPSLSSSSIYSASSPHIVESDREILWLEVDCVLISVILMYQDDTRWHPFQNKHLNTVLLSRTSYLTWSQYTCLLQNDSHGIIRMHWHLNHLWDKTIFHIIPLLILLYIQLLLLILLKVIERYCDWKWIVFSFPWFKCTKMILDDLPFRIIISIQSYWVRLHIWVDPNIDDCCKMIVMVSSECIGILIKYETKQSFTSFHSTFFFYIFILFSTCCWKW